MARRRLCEGRVCIVTGARRRIGREHALMLAARGAKELDAIVRRLIAAAVPRTTMADTA